MNDGQGIWDRDFIRDYLVGVIDLRRGQAVHAVAGDRSNYVPLQRMGGDPIRMATAYGEFGLRRVYIADLDAIELHADPSPALHGILDALPRETAMFIDIGWRGDESASVRAMIKSLSNDHPLIQWIAASEAAESIDSMKKLVDLCDATRVWVGLDYLAGHWISERVREIEYCTEASRLNVRGAVVLDLKSVGCAGGPSTILKCQQLAQAHSNWTLISGGGIRGETDARNLVDVGCSGCLVATAIQDLL